MLVMGIFDAVRGWLSSDGLRGVLESTGLDEHVDGLIGEGSAVADGLGVDLGQVTESLGLDGVVDSLPEDPLPRSSDGVGE